MKTLKIFGDTVPVEPLICRDCRVEVHTNEEQMVVCPRCGASQHMQQVIYDGVRYVTYMCGGKEVAARNRPDGILGEAYTEPEEPQFLVSSVLRLRNQQ